VLAQQLDKFSALAAEDGDMPGVRCLVQYGLYQSGESLKAAPAVGFKRATSGH
jgi:hypothetical protein